MIPSAKSPQAGLLKGEQDTGFDNDPVLRMLGVGKELWSDERADAFVERLRSEDPPPALPPLFRPQQELPDAIWLRLQGCVGETFHTATGKPFTFEVEGAGVWFFREGRSINRKLTRAQVEIAISRCPLQSTTEIKDLMDYSYLFAVLMDPRIRQKDW